MARNSKSPMSWNILKHQVDLDKVLAWLDIHGTHQGDEIIAPCPLPSHPGSDVNPSFGINVNKKVFNCFTCGEGGSLPTLIMHLHHIEYPEAIEALIGFITGDVDDDSSFEDHLRQILFWDDEAQDIEFPVFNDRILDPWMVGAIPALGPEWDPPGTPNRRRGITLEMQRVLKLGYDPEHYRRLKNEDEYVGEAIIIPHYFEGSLVGYQSGWLDANRPKKIPKYTNTRNFPRGETLYNFDRAIESADSTCYVVEAPITTAYIEGLGYSSVAAFGAELTRDQYDLLANFDRLVAAFDNDEAGYKATRKFCLNMREVVQAWVLAPVNVEKGNLNDISPREVHMHLQPMLMPAYKWLLQEGW